MKTYPLIIVAALFATTIGCATPGRIFKGVNTGTQETASVSRFERELNIARLLENHDQVGEASAVYERVVKVDPANCIANHRLGVLAARRKEYDSAHQYFDTALKAEQPSPELLADIGYVFFLENNLPHAEEKFRQSLQVDSYNKQTRNNLGLVLARQGRDEEALAEFQKSVGDAEAYSNLAYVQTQIGAIDKAEQNYHKALERNNALKPAAEALLQIAGMKGSLDIAPINVNEQVARREAAPAKQTATIEPVEVPATAVASGQEQNISLQQPAKFVQKVTHEEEASMPIQAERAIHFDGDADADSVVPAHASLSDLPTMPENEGGADDVIRMSYGDYPQPQTIPTSIPTPQIPTVRMLPPVPSETAPRTPVVTSISG